MDSRLVASVVLIASCLWQTGCSSLPAAVAVQQEPAAGHEIPPTDPALDHFIAWIPAEQAQTATVARAMTHISLGQARTTASRELCEGAVLRQGQVTESFGPLPVHNPATQGGKPVWYYRISQLPGLSGCENHTRTSLYQAMRKQLPDWIRIEQARPGPQQLGLLGP